MRELHPFCKDCREYRTIECSGSYQSEPNCRLWKLSKYEISHPYVISLKLIDGAMKPDFETVVELHIYDNADDLLSISFIVGIVVYSDSNEIIVRTIEEVPAEYDNITVSFYVKCRLTKK